MKRYFYLFLLLLLVILPVSGQKRQPSESWRTACRALCEKKYDACLRDAGSDGQKKDECRRNYRGCVNWCLNPPRQG
jgi:hypothetical protein